MHSNSITATNRWHIKKAPTTDTAIMRSQCASLLLILTFFFFGIIMNPLHQYYDYNERYQSRASLRRDEESIALMNIRKKVLQESDSSIYYSEEEEYNEKDVATMVATEAAPIQTNFSGILPLSFKPWSYPLPCYVPDDDWKSVSVQSSPTRRGFLFLKPYKTGSSTTSGINLRIARNVAIRTKRDFDICKGW